jgi:hypothetical protein
MIVVVLVVVAPVAVAIFWSVGGEEVHVAALDVDIVRMDTHVILRKRLYGPIVCGTSSSCRQDIAEAE